MKSRHLSDEQALDLAMSEAGLDENHAHLEECDVCRDRVRHARDGWRLAVDTDIPEPSPLYWEASKRRLGRELDAEDARRRQRRWLTLAATAAAILATIAILAPVFVGLGRDQRAETSVDAWSALPRVEDDPSLPMIERMLDVETEHAIGCCLGSCVLVLSDEEVRVVSESLRVEMGRSL
ncbi:MAG: hypothetical protein JXO72_10940 [Vicinamibacteria bacterium]|nr:hypothetical protein [Vicinamibacteria bacterium]